jgi:ATP-dependent exoDNAse (exonuclease V) beta subunit
VVDFKTDRELTGARAAYEAQVALYARAVSAATGEPARGVLLVL